jgi:hypothetical protein
MGLQIVRAAVICIVACILSACEWEGRSTPPTASPQGDERETARAFFGSYRDQDFTSYEDAERAAGFRIPRPSPEYPLAFNSITLRTFPGGKPPTAEAQYFYPPMAPNSIGLVVGAEDSWALKDGTSGRDVLTYGKATVIGGKNGWLNRDDRIAMSFSFQCGALHAEESLWCVVRSGSPITRVVFEAFIASIE